MKKATKILSVLLCLLLFGCTVPEASDLFKGTTSDETEQTDIKTDERASSDGAADSSVLGKFMFDHLPLLADEKNLLFSPLSAAACLAMLANGADGNTRTQIENAYGITVEELNTAIVSYIKNLYTAEDCKVSLADSVWIKETQGFTVKEDFIEQVASSYRAGIYTAPFDQTTVDAVNKWVSDNTDGLIPSVIDQIDPNTLMYLINTLLFEADWEEPVPDVCTYPDSPFTNEDKSISTATLLGFSSSDYFRDENTEGTSFSYAGGKYAFMAFLPTEGTDMASYLRSFTAEKWQNLMKSNTKKESVVAKLPEFTTQSKIELNGVWQSLGMTDMFGDLADFSKISDMPLYCSKAFQKCYIEVSQSGTKAAAATVIEMNMKSAYAPKKEKIYLTFDRPFFYAIVDTDNNLPLFYGTVTHLSQK